MQTTDHITIVGAGLVGTSLACMLAPYFEVSLYEKCLPIALTTASVDDRPISLALGSKHILETLSLWLVLAEYAQAIETVNVSEHGVFGGVTFSAQDLKKPALGFVVPFCHLQQVLYQKAASHTNVTIQTAKPIPEIFSDNIGLIIACDGSVSEVRDYLDAPTQTVDHHEVADIFKLNLTEEHNATAFERFTEKGTLALLPMPNKLAYQCVWTHGERHTVDPQKIMDYFKGQIPKIKSIERKTQYPLKTMIAKAPIQERCVLMGNAAHTVYPLAAQGFNLGLRDAAALAETLVDAKTERQDIGARETLERYLAWRLPDQKRITHLTNSLVSVFGLQLPLLKPLRGLAMLAMDCVPSLKMRLAKRTMGLSGRQPKLMRGVELME